MQDQLSRIVNERYIRPTNRIIRNIQETTLENERDNKAHAIEQGHVAHQIHIIAKRLLCSAASAA